MEKHFPQAIHMICSIFFPASPKHVVISGVIVKAPFFILEKEALDPDMLQFLESMYICEDDKLNP